MAVQTVLMWVALVGLSVLAPLLFALWCKERQLFPGRRLLATYRRLPWFGQILLLAFAAHLIVYGSTKTNVTDGVSGEVSSSQRLAERQPSEAMHPKAARRVLHVPTISADDIARGYRLAEVTTNASISYEMPDDATLCGNWHLRGAYDDVTRIDLGDWRFPLGTNSYNRFWAFVSATLSPTIRDEQHALVAIDETLSAIPRQSALWLSADSPLVRRITWEDFVLGRVPISTADNETNAASFVSAQVELHRNGDFVTRANDVEKTYRRINPNDWDGDGVPNERDPNPHVYDGDHFGPEQVLPEGANTNAYCWIDVVVPHVDALVTFEGDGPSDLADPDFIARAGETNRVTLLIGKTYKMRCDQPIEIVGRSDPAIEVDYGSDAIIVCRPVEIGILSSISNEGRLSRQVSRARMRSTSSQHRATSFTMTVTPAGLDGEFVWTNACCTVTGSGRYFVLSCTDMCSCEGRPATGYFAYEGYQMFVAGGSCGCGLDDPGHNGDEEGEPPLESQLPVYAAFSKAVIFLEDEYYNTPTEYVPWSSTTTELTITANGGSSGGLLTVEISGDANLIQYNGQRLPLTRELDPYEVFELENVYRAVRESSCEKEIEVVATFVPNDATLPSTSRTAATAVRVEVEPVIIREGCEHRHRMGIREIFHVWTFPDNHGSEIEKESGWVCPHYGDSKSVQCPYESSSNGVSVRIFGCVYEPMIFVIEPVSILCTYGIVVDAGFNVGNAGGVGMSIFPYIQPEEVSFSEVKMMEIPTIVGAEPPDGYFDNERYSLVWAHTKRNGAGVWHRPGGDNLFFNDEPMFVEPCPQPWCYGKINWSIPIGWAALEAVGPADVIKELPVEYNQIFTINNMGELSVEKFDQWVKRAPSGVITHSTGIINVN